MKNVGWESLEMEESEYALDGPATSRCGQNISGHIGFDPYTLRKKRFFSHGLTDVPGEGHIGITNDLVLQTSKYTANR